MRAGDVLARIPRESSKTRDITGGLPRVAELFEARKPKDFAIISEIDGRVEFGKDYKTKRRIVVVPEDASEEPREYLIPKGKHISVQEGDYVQRGDLLMDGNPVPHDILSVLGVEALANYLINEIQEVYRLQGVKINDKHIEVIVRQMLQKIEIDGSRRYHLPDRRAGRPAASSRRSTPRREGDGLRPARAEPVLQGITKASLQTGSLHLGRVVPGDDPGADRGGGLGPGRRADGLKENVIVGRLIPAGTGAVMNRLKAVAAERDRDWRRDCPRPTRPAPAPASSKAQDGTGRPGNRRALVPGPASGRGRLRRKARDKQLEEFPGFLADSAR